MPAAQKIACHFWQDHTRILKHLDFFKNDVGPRVKSYFEHILIDCPENGPSLTKNLQIFEAEIINFNFFKTFDHQNFQYQFKSELLII